MDTILATVADILYTMDEIEELYAVYKKGMPTMTKMELIGCLIESDPERFVRRIWVDFLGLEEYGGDVMISYRLGAREAARLHNLAFGSPMPLGMGKKDLLHKLLACWNEPPVLGVSFLSEGQTKHNDNACGVCPNGHGMMTGRVRGDGICDVCHAGVRGGAFVDACAQCDFWICQQCQLKLGKYGAPAKSAASVHGNKMAPLSSPPPRVTVPQLPLPDGCLYHAFLTHSWVKDGKGRDTHARVSRINDHLKARGMVTWFDGDRMEGEIADKMCEGIDDSAAIVVFVSKAYLDKVASKNPNDNCKKEFKYATQRKSATKMVPVPMEPDCLMPGNWKGQVGMELGGTLFKANFAEDADFEEQAEALFDEILRVAGVNTPPSAPTHPHARKTRM
ncbi:hypothetical protein EMIHUDRAFT_222110 [Emiliania huxleyi CCMP1516]|uniref:TIR domain-containing protein n=2 Tax=Emiliania huxleyi TaxID=2903 RepID=A0A0D3KZ61_EMIH1|nr:hypothetical protein EMIHUDRAFT_222110 [Emiliania huxleyi CCMP1516]EOD41046.1 hypothetical protein EMIHUDRAFT_222110 [Emiliania huxleyi CCMP1516]|eukprot:XP_005793475.1 hypothetical protein EMIHUDRAFT_222110 [Emiliania huxleyi CCMP1516]